MKNRFLGGIIAFFVGFFAFAQQGGMWIPSLLSQGNIKEMRQLGAKISAKDIYNTNQSSYKDAVPQFNGGCTAEMISSNGLLLTNHHCGYGQIQAHSSLEHDYLTNGFWAKNYQEELPNPGTNVAFVVRIEDVTQKILKNTEQEKNPEEKQKIIQKNINECVQNSPKEAWQENRIRSFFDGNQYLLFVVEVFKDVRLVGAPPSSIGKFGADTDNWAWPRHTGDFSLFRVYADKNNRPAEYSPQNVPYKPKHYFPISLKGLSQGDFTMVLGYPGTTQEYLPAVAIEQIIKVINPARIAVRDAVLKVQERYMRADPQIKIQYASKNARIANYWKKWKGENLGLIKTQAVAKKKAQEVDFQRKIEKSGKSQYASLLADFQQKYAQYQDYDLAVNLYQEVVMRNVEILSIALKISALEDIYAKRGEQSFSDRKNNLLQGLKNTYKDYNSTVDQEIFTQALGVYFKLMPEAFLPEGFSKNTDIQQITQQVFSQSGLISFSGAEKMLTGTPEQVLKNINADTAVKFVSSLRTVLYQKVLPEYYTLTEQIDELQRLYMKAILEFSSPKDRIFPDANSTLRITYGKIKGFSPADAVEYLPFTYLDGVMEKYIPADYEFDVPEKLIDLYQRKDYGMYADKNGKMPVCFIATNHTTGGNSGSPALDAQGNLIGLNFDRVWEGTMSDIYYDPDICRNIMVDMRYVLFIIDKYAGAEHLIKEMKIIK